MRKLLDWIADRLGYQRKLPFDDPETLSTLDWPPDYLSIDTMPNNLMLEPLDFTGCWFSESDAPAPTITMEIKEE